MPDLIYWISEQLIVKSPDPCWFGAFAFYFLMFESGWGLSAIRLNVIWR
jgi:hypothetical protein